jgi:NTE family protein
MFFSKKAAQPAWDPAAARAKFGLTLSGAERAAIQAKLPASSIPGVYFADGVFEGGGVLGVSFLGAARVCSDVGLRWKGLAGTSAGAITASLLAATSSIDELEDTFRTLDFMGFLGKPTSFINVDSNPGDDLQEPVWMIMRLLGSRQLGEYSSDPFRDWLEQALGSIRTFADIPSVEPDRQLKVVVSDITKGQMLVLPDSLAPGSQAAFSIAEAVRLSMSIPFFFAPGQLDGSYIVDGGMLSNYPIWIYDEPVPGVLPAWPTFGFRLYDRAEDQPNVIDSVAGMATAMVKTMLHAHDRFIMSASKRTRTIDIDLTNVGITATDFSLTNDQKDELYRRGYVRTKQFFVEEWSWEKHLASRGFVAAI